jgi:peroxiredoxin
MTGRFMEMEKLMRKIWTPLMSVALIGMLAAPLRAREPKAALGQPAPQFSLKDLSGKDVSLSEYSGKIVVLEWVNPECPFVQRHYKAQTMTKLADKYKGQDVAWLSIASGATADKPDMLRQFAQNQKLGHPILLDPTRQVAQAYAAKTTPHMFVISKDGKLAYMGGIDDDAAGDKGDKATNYVDKALSQLAAGQPVSQPETKSYGCTIK